MSPSCCVCFVKLLGYLVVFRAMAGVLRWVSNTFMKKRSVSKFGKWAVVTGATDGIGKAMATELAMRGVSIVLVSRSIDKLKETEKDINVMLKKGNVLGVEIRVVAVDFSEPKEKVYPVLKAATEGLEVGIVVNNVGISYPHAKYFNEVDDSLLNQLVEVNVRSVLNTTSIYYGGMFERRRGMIVNVASAAATLPSDPLYAGYAATKSVAVKLSQSLAAESREKGVIVQCHAPLLVTSKLSKVRKPSLFCPTPAQYAKAAIRCMETSDEAVCCPYWTHQLQMLIANCVPLSIWNMIRLGQTKAIRSKALKKSQEGRQD